MPDDNLLAATDAIDVSTTVEQLRAQLTALNLNSKGNKATVKKRLAAVKKHGISHPGPTLSREELIKRNEQKRRETPLEYLLVIDFEATCDESTTAKISSSSTKEEDFAEIIEFPIVLVDLKASKILAKSSWHVRPVLRPQLSDFCKELTGITQEQVDGAETFSQVLSHVNEWLLQHCTSFQPPIICDVIKPSGVSMELEGVDKESAQSILTNAKHRIQNWSIVTDGRSDLEGFLTNQLKLSELKFPHWTLGPYIDSRAVFASFSKIGRVPLLQQLQFLGLTFQGKEHCGLDDAVNIARIMIEVKKRGFRLAVNRYIDNAERGWMYSCGPPLRGGRLGHGGIVQAQKRA